MIFYGESQEFVLTLRHIVAQLMALTSNLKQNLLLLPGNTVDIKSDWFLLKDRHLPKGFPPFLFFSTDQMTLC